MDTQPNSAREIAKCLHELWEAKELQDVSVMVQNVKFECHRSILFACSKFFRGLFRSGMRETSEKVVVLHDISAETFRFVLETIYGGEPSLTRSNVTDVWHAATQLQVEFLMKECENFIVNNTDLENYEEVYKNGSLLDSKAVLTVVLNFMKNNFTTFKDTDLFLHITFDEILEIVKSQELISESEDVVIESILKWVTYEEEDSESEEAQAEAFKIKEQSHGGNHKEITINVSNGKYENDNINNTESTQDHHPNEEEGALNKVHPGGDDETETNDTSVLNRTHENTNLYAAQADLETVLEKASMDRREEDARSDVGDLRNQKSLLRGKKDLHGEGIISLKRMDYLATLLNASRTYLISPDCLGMMLNHDVIIGNTECRDIVNEAAMYMLQKGGRHGQWPSLAMHRNCSDMENVAVYMQNNNVVSIYSFTKGKSFIYVHLPFSYNHQMVVFDNEIFGFAWDGSVSTQWGCSNKLTGAWEVSPTIANFKDFVPLSHDDSIYLFGRSNKTVQVLKPRSGVPTSAISFPSDEFVTAAAAVGKHILVFCTGKVTNGKHETIVHCLDTRSNTWSRLNHIDGPANNLISFQDEAKTRYILQTNGNLWKICNKQGPAPVDFIFVTKMWDFDYKLYGAVSFRSELWICGEPLTSANNNNEFPKELPGVFKRIKWMWGDTSYGSTYLPAILSKKWLK